MRVLFHLNKKLPPASYSPSPAYKSLPLAQGCGDICKHILQHISVKENTESCGILRRETN